MPHWVPSRMWEGQDIYIVGGGPSLSTFDWELIRGKKTIGCNSAFILGPHIVKIVIFADLTWWERIGKEQLPKYGGIVVACCPPLVDGPDHIPEWVLTVDREERKNGLSLKSLGYNGNTGSLAINLALCLGARRVFLLGFDMKLDDNTKKANWHDVRYEVGQPEVYSLFKSRMRFVARDVPVMFPGSEVINVTDDSDLNVFPKVSLEEHFGAVARSVR